MADELTKKRAIQELCEDIFATRNLIVSDFDDMEIFEVVKPGLPATTRRSRSTHLVLYQLARHRQDRQQSARCP